MRAWLLACAVWLRAAADGEGACPVDDVALLQLSGQDAFRGRATCVAQYGRTVNKVFPGFAKHLKLRHWGGQAKAGRPEQPPVLVAGFDLAGRWSLAAFMRQHQLQVSHTRPGLPTQLLHEADVATLGRRVPDLGDCARRVNKVRFARAFKQQQRVISDNLLQHHFLDFYALDPNAQVILLKEPKTRQHGRRGRAPVESSCGQAQATITPQKTQQLLQAHRRLVKCLVPRAKLFEVDASDIRNVDTRGLARFLGLQPLPFDPPFPRLRLPAQHAVALQLPKGKKANKESTGAAGKSLAVCITGQLKRLELKSKLQNVILPAQRAGLNVRVAVVVDPAAAPVYVHTARGPGTRLAKDVTMIDGPYGKLKEIERDFPASVSVIVEPFKPTLYQVDTRYVRELGKNNGDAETRAKSHVKQWQSLHKCWDLIQDLDPDYTLRLRDDDIVYDTWVPSGTAPGLVVPKCASFGGVNDKGALAISAPVAKAYLTSPFEVGVFNFSAVYRLHKQSAETKRQPLRPERLLKFILHLQDVSVEKVEMDKAPFLPGHFVQTAGQNYVCYFYSMHDCLTPKKVKELKTKGLQFGGKQKSGMERWACEVAPQ